MRLAPLFLSTMVLWASAAYPCADDDDHHGSHHGNNKGHGGKHAERHEESHQVSISSKSDTLSGTVTMNVAGMMCSSCREKLEAAVKKIPEVASVTADVKKKTMTVTLNTNLARATLEAAITDAGFSPR
jgi:copper chaperone CopZ